MSRNTVCGGGDGEEEEERGEEPGDGEHLCWVGTELYGVPLSGVDWTGRGPYFAVKLEFYYSSICR